ncbi:hypothetical protein [Streptomyces griseocarneus]|uniref:hypothetical protein n=1 Tax=Streptomyces griseocarneus TaxID=51201 RepID=UPI00167E3E31|nr:hypothetical protein [Streptomyces griseocarneus]MBZ6475883.1 hypothetical protein [Streptomyces griseocarneus]GHG50224.1 hypothetical protein GCM10018779_10140 [Streptomyces griseocarneus]
MSFVALDEGRRSARRRLALLIAGALVVGGATTFLVLSPDDSRKTDKPTAGPTASASTQAQTGGSNVPTVLPKPKDVKDGVPVGYPHTLEGAISAAAHYGDVLDLFNPKAAEQQARVMAAPNHRMMLETYMVQSAQTARTNEGLPADGESDNANFITTQSRAYHVANSTADSVTVWILMDCQTSVRGVARSTTQVRGVVLVWTDGDWKMSLRTLDGLPDNAPKNVTPNSQNAAQEGWRSLAYEK